MSRRVSLAIVALAVAMLIAAAPAAGADWVGGQVIVGFKGDVGAARAEALVERLGGRVERRLARIGAATVRPRRGHLLSDLRRRLRARGEVRYVERDHFLRKTETPDDPLFARQYALQPGTAGVSATQAWDRRTSCALVAVLDSGVQYDHPDLDPNIWHNSGEIKANGKDDDDNGYVDDYYGADVQDQSGSGGDDEGHGTHVAGVVAGRGDNATGISGVCWSGKVMPVRFMGANGRGSTSDAISGIEYAVHEQAKVINCSFGSSSKSSALEDAIDHAQDKGVLLVVAAGNDGESIDAEPAYPASYTQGNILTVAATTANGSLASFSNFGSKSVDLAAPGDQIESTYPESAYKLLSGTSMAAPFVAGAAAMLRQEEPDMTYKELRSALKDSVEPLPALAGKTVTGGLLDVDRALAAGERSLHTSHTS
jgi:subtilisin family serine protease